jgi:hypothetical protein
MNAECPLTTIPVSADSTIASAQADLASVDHIKVNDRLLKQAFNPSTDSLPGVARLPHADSEEELNHVVDQATRNEVTFACGVKGTGVRFVIRTVCRLQEADLDTLVTGTAHDLLDCIADRLDAEIVTKPGGMSAVLRIKNGEQEGMSEATRTPSIVVADLNEVAFCPAIHKRKFGAVIVVQAEDAEIRQAMHAAGLATEKIIFVGDPYWPANRQDVFDLAGITSSLLHGKNDPRLLVLPVGAQVGANVAQAVNRAAYGRRLTPVRQLSEFDRRYLRQTMRIFDTGCYLSPSSDATTGGFAFTALSALLTAAVTSEWPDHEGPVADPLQVAVFTPHEPQQKILRGLDHDLILSYGTSDLKQPFSSQADQVVVDLHHPTTLVGPETNGNGAGHDLRFLTAACTATGFGATLVGHIQKLEQILPTDAPYRRYLDAFKQVGAVVEPYPLALLTPELSLDAPGLGFYTESGAAWRQLHQDVATAQEGVMWNLPDFVASDLGAGHSATLSQRSGIEQILVAPVDATTMQQMTAQGFRVITAQLGEAAVFIDRDLVWLLGAPRPGVSGCPFARVRGPRTAQVLAEIFGLQSLFTPLTK